LEDRRGSWGSWWGKIQKKRKKVPKKSYNSNLEDERKTLRGENSLELSVARKKKTKIDFTAGSQ